MLNSLDLPGKPGDTRIVVAMSGGVDSSVVAGLLKRDGYDVIGMTLQLYDHGQAIHRKGACCAGQDIHDAKRVAQILDIPHYVLNYEKRFREAVIDPFAKSYRDGETPVPCITCNQTVKFADLLAMAKELGADAMATGHYIRSKLVGDNSGKRSMFRPLDEGRDQSYFLFATTQEQLDYLRFPLGSVSKARVREMATELGLEIADKPDSQDICFVPEGKYASVISSMNEGVDQSGDIVNLDGEVLGRHEGIINFTIGQRRGIGVAMGEPIYVVHIDHRTKRVIVGPREALATRRLYLRDVNWIGDDALGDTLDKPLELFVKVRSTRPPVAACLSRINDEICVDIHDGETGVAPGQACVFYADEAPDTQILGGGFIARTGSDPAIETKLNALLGAGENTEGRKVRVHL